MSSKEVAASLGVSAATLSRWRFEGTGPPYLKLGSTLKALVRYRRADVLPYVAKCERRMTASTAPAAGGQPTTRLSNGSMRTSDG